MKIIELTKSGLGELGIKDAFQCFPDNRGELTVLAEGNDSFSLKTTNSIAGVFRGMHYQSTPYEQKKIVTVQSGLVREFVADHANLNTVYTWLFDGNMGWLEIPSNFYHGYYVLEKSTFIYMCLGEYSEKHERQINICKHVEQYFTKGLIISDKDKNAKVIENV